MPRRLAIPAVIAFAALVAPAAASAQTNRLNFTSGPWRGGPVQTDDGQLSACVMYSQAGGGSQFFFRLSREFNFSLGLVNQRWSLQPGATERMAFWIDGGAKTEADARAAHAGGSAA